MPKQRRAKGEGSIVERPDGLWQFSIDLGKDDGGKRQRKYIYAKTKAALLRKLADERVRGRGTIRVTVTDTVGAWVESWLRDEVEPNVARSTYAVWELAWRLHAKPLIASKRLERFMPGDVSRVYAALREKKLGGRSTQIVAQVMRSAFEAAIRHGKYAIANPWWAVPVPRHEAKEARALDAKEARKFVQATRGNRFEALWLLSLLAGCRLGECLGLTWECVDLKKGQVRIRQQATEVGGVTKIGPIKTKSSRRIVDIGELTIDALQRRRQTANREGHRSPLVFTTRTGGFPSRTNLRRREFAEVCKRAEISGLRIHDLRHSMTAHAIAAGLSPIVVAARLGHSSTRMTLDRYGHELPGQQREAALAIEDRLARLPRRQRAAALDK